MASTLKNTWDLYAQETPERVRLLDLFMVVLTMQGSTLLIYCFIVGTFPFNSFLSGFIACFGTCILTACLRMQVLDPEKFRITSERTFADYLVANLFLHLGCICFLG